MKRLKMTATETITFEEGCNKYLDNCRQRNLREDTKNSTSRVILYSVNISILRCH